MKVVFLEPVEGTANPGEVKDVANGFARNYLLPRGLAIPATPAALQRAEALARQEERRQAKLDADARGLIAKLDGLVLTFEERVGEQGRLYGSVTVSHIAERLSETLGQEFDRHKVLLPEALRHLGRHEVRLRLSRNVEATIAADIVPIGGAASAEPAMPLAAEETIDAAGAEEEPAGVAGEDEA